MTHSFRRFGIMLVVSALLVSALPSMAAPEQARPVAWLALRSYQRLEQRLREMSTMAQTPGLADMMLGMVQLQLAGMGGVDRQRPIGVVVPTVSLAGQPPIAVLLPYTDRDAILHTLQTFFPQTLIEDGSKLSLQGGPRPAFGRLDAQRNILVIASTPEALAGPDLVLPADLFGAQDDGPDLVLRIDLEAVKQQLDTAWTGMLASMEQVWHKALQKAAEDKAISATEKTAMTAYITLSQKALRQLLDDVSVGESRLTLAPQGWVFDLEAQMRPSSPSAAFVNAQSEHTSQVAQLFTPNPETLMRVAYNVRMTDSMRQDLTALLPLVRQMFDAKLAARPSLTPEQRAAGSKVIESYIGLLEQWYTQKELEAAVEFRMQEAGFEATGWLPFTNSTRVLGTMLDMLEQVPMLTSETAAKVTRDAGKHHAVAWHRVDFPQAVAPEVPPSLFVAATGNLVMAHLGSTVDPLQGLINRLDALKPQTQTQTDALVHLELFIAPLLKFGISKRPAGKEPDPMSQAIMTRLQRGPDEPFVMDVLMRQNAATLRYAVPGALLQGMAEVIGQQVTQQLRGGGEKKNGGVKPKQQ